MAQIDTQITIFTLPQDCKNRDDAWRLIETAITPKAALKRVPWLTDAGCLGTGLEAAAFRTWLSEGGNSMFQTATLRAFATTVTWVEPWREVEPGVVR